MATKKQGSVIARVAQCLKNSKCSFILGAGISVDADSPSWDNLLKKLLQNIPEHKPIDETAYPSTNSKCGWSALITARYIISDYLKPKELTKRMRGIIHIRQKCKYEKNRTAIPVIADITRQCNIESILTFNYDEFVEEALV